ncbi:MAG: DUF3800 domain-containing protein [Bacteroidota bacterium]
MKTNIRTIYFDESGFTGYNLLDKDQQVFSIGSTDITPDEAEEILKSSFPNYAGKEFKFNNIWGSKNQKGLIELSNRISNSGANFYGWMIDKRFAVLVKIVDQLIEPITTANGFDFYANGFNRKYTNYIYYGFQIHSPQWIDSLLESYQKFSRYPSEVSLKQMIKEFVVLKKKVHKNIRLFLDQMIDGANIVSRIYNLDDYKRTNELHLTTMVAMVSYWRDNHAEDFIIVHDASANFSRQNELWSKITNKDVNEIVLPNGDGTMTNYPLRVIETRGENSINNFSIQLCDLIGGFISRYFAPDLTEKDKEFIDQCVTAGMDKLMYNSIKPATDFPEFPPKRLSGPDVVDKMTSIINARSK